MASFELSFSNGHLFVTLPEGTFLLDTGAPQSFGECGTIAVAGSEFRLQPGFMGLTADKLSGFVSKPVAGLLGADVLNRFDILIDVPRREVSFTDSPLDLQGQSIPLRFALGVPILQASIGGQPTSLFFDTGAQVSYWQDELLASFPSAGTISDFYPGFGDFTTETFMAPCTIGTVQCDIRCGQLPGLLGMTLSLAGTEGIIGNEILLTRRAAYLPRRSLLVLA